MIKCLSCATENRDGSQFCEECGARLRLENDSRFEQPAADSLVSEMPVFQSSAGVTSVGTVLPSQFERQQTSSPEKKESLGAVGNSNGSEPHATLIVERGDSVGKQFSLVARESNIGRWDADNGVFPDVDLDKHDPEAKISRRHARIVRRASGEYAIEDLGSTNGTFVNRGRRLIPGQENPLADGDEIIIGKTFLRFRVGE